MKQNNWQDLQDIVVEWRDNVLTDATLEGALNHLVREIKDLKKSPYDPLAIADVFILLISICQSVGFSMDEIKEAVAAKMAINESRLWGSADEEGVIKYIKETKL